jgi:hypothetical protein
VLICDPLIDVRGNLIGYVMIGVSVLYFQSVPGSRGDRTYNVKQLISSISVLFSQLNYFPSGLAMLAFIAGYAHRVGEMLEGRSGAACACHRLPVFAHVLCCVRLCSVGGGGEQYA